MEVDATPASHATSDGGVEHPVAQGIRGSDTDGDGLESLGGDLTEATAKLATIQKALASGGGPNDVRSSLSNVASGLAEQLSSINGEMSKIREELYGEAGIGGIAKELEKLKRCSVGETLDNKGSLDGILGRASGGSASSSSERRPARSGVGAARSCGVGDSASVPERRRRTPEERDRDLEKLRQRLAQRRSAPKTSTGWEKVLLLLVVIVCLYISSPFFRSEVNGLMAKLLQGDLFGNQDGDQEDADFEF
mmetsp:Transcript_107463/g.302397  ORF Transcript_107463/g.302397 Transcript_107463/m.302397 type:complete len:251 (-) Transcript_107463:187-939(-)